MVRLDEFVYLVNPRSGGQAGRRLLAELRRQLPAERVYSTAESRAADLAARWHGRVAGLIACGGDGTAASLLEGAASAAAGGQPTAVGILPLGTGNDLARVAQAPLSGPLAARLAWLTTAQAQPLDRWTLAGPSGRRAWFNYCSWGCDARIAGRFQRLRDLHGGLLRARAANLLCYAGLGLHEPGAALGIDLVLPTGNVVLPGWTRSLVVANIPSYAGGRRLGPRIAADDGRCDVFGLGSGIALGIGLSGWRRPRGHGAHAGMAVRLRRGLHLQLDGEPALAPPGTYRIDHGGVMRLLCAPASGAVVAPAP